MIKTITLTGIFLKFNQQKLGSNDIKFFLWYKYDKLCCGCLHNFEATIRDVKDVIAGPVNVRRCENLWSAI